MKVFTTIRPTINAGYAKYNKSQVKHNKRTFINLYKLASTHTTKEFTSSTPIVPEPMHLQEKLTHKLNHVVDRIDNTKHTSGNTYDKVKTIVVDRIEQRYSKDDADCVKRVSGLVKKGNLVYI